MAAHESGAQHLQVESVDIDVAGLICVLRGRRVMFDFDLARLYRVTTRRLNEQVRRNLARFPDDFLFRLTPEEVTVMRSQFAAASVSRRNFRHRPYAFTEHGVTMLSAVL
ncbi:MAG TPA: ORF6N domain-containing protein [Gemmatimonadaceae bacterium]|nr:ORF6N domain-containing protein [Gemmatimonadaceae bacterium]